MTQRTERIDELLRQEIGAILSREVQDPRIGFATVTEVETTPDLGHARVWVSVIGQKGERDQTIAALGHAMSFVRRELGTRLRLKRIPELHVRLDDSIERGTRVLHLLHELEAGHEPPDAPIGESLPTPVPRLPHEGDAPEPRDGLPLPGVGEPIKAKPGDRARRRGPRSEAKGGRSPDYPATRQRRPRR